MGRAASTATATDAAASAAAVVAIAVAAAAATAAPSALCLKTAGGWRGEEGEGWGKKGREGKGNVWRK